jgi:hypothetical protein
MSDGEDTLDRSIRTVVRAAVRDMPSSEAVVVTNEPGRTSHRWIAVAAATVVAVGGVAAIALSRPDRARVVTPASTTRPSITETTTTSASTTTSTAPSSTLPPEEQSDVPQTVTGPLRPHVVYSSGVGAAANELGLEHDCSYCASPWAPLTTSDGRLVLADTVNQRWVVVTNGKPHAVPFAANTTIDGQPRLGPDGKVYAPMAVTTGTPPSTTTAYIAFVFQVDDMATSNASYPINGGNYSYIEFAGNQLLDGPGGLPVTRVSSPARDVATVTRPDEHTLVVTYLGSSRRWSFPTNWVPGELATLNDGSVVARVAVVVGAPRTYYTRLWADGTASSGTVDGVSSTANGSITMDNNGISQMELDGQTWHVVRYDLPTRPS